MTACSCEIAEKQREIAINAKNILFFMGGEDTKNLENRMLIFCKAFKIQLTYSTELALNVLLLLAKPNIFD